MTSRRTNETNENEDEEPKRMSRIMGAEFDACPLLLYDALRKDEGRHLITIIDTKTGAI